MSQGIVGETIGARGIRPGWKIFFWAAAAFNFLVGMAGMLSPVASPDARIVGLLVFCFGIIYVLVARDPERYAATLWAGVIGKIGVVALLGPGQFGGEGHPLLMAILALDGVFALGFLAFLLGRDE